jgi:hypothetical protein
MTLQSSGAISLNQIATEYGGDAPHSLLEYYKSADNNYVPAILNETVTASNLTQNSLNHINRGVYTRTPIVNYTSGNKTYLYYHSLWHDNGATGTSNYQFTVSHTGTYTCGGSNMRQQSSGSATYKIFLDGTLEEQWTSSGNNSFGSIQTRTFTITDTSQVIKITSSWPSSGWGGCVVRIGGSDYDVNTVSTTVNANVPLASVGGAVSINNFYSGRKT